MIQIQKEFHQSILWMKLYIFCERERSGMIDETNTKYKQIRFEKRKN